MDGVGCLSKIVPSSVVRTRLDDPDGHPIDHDHPAVVIAVDEENGFLEVVAISTKLEMGDKNFHYPMPFGRDAKSGLPDKCVAKANWRAKVRIEDCNKIGHIPSRTLDEVNELRKEYLALSKRST